MRSQSEAGLHGHAYMAAYSASKGAVIALTKSLAREFSIQGVRVNAVAPGGTLTPLLTSLQLPEGINPSLLDNVQQPGQRFGLPEEIASVVAMLASQDGSFINGEVIRLDVRRSIIVLYCIYLFFCWKKKQTN